MATGKIGVTTENIFPVIKKFLYSDHEIFLRELVSNAIDATGKIKTLAAFGDFKGTLGDDLQVRVSVDKEAGTLTVSDHGIGMDADDINKYINQIAFSGAEEFLAKYKDNANSIIGHFGLGFYSAFMVSTKVVIRSLSYKEGAKAVEWSCDGSPEYSLTEIEKADRGTDIILYIDDDSKQFLEQDKINELLKKYCRFLPVPVISGKQKEWKDGKYVDTDRDNVVNATEPLWTKKPADLTDADYLKFYRELMPGQDDPMFWIHLNVDFPFTLTGILYFPKIKSNIDVQKNRIQLYCNQVYVTDQVEGVVPEFMMLMQGVIDSPDIPLNVSRSYLQSDSEVKKISGYISKKVAEKLDKLFSDDRKAYEAKWDDIKIFIEYGMLTDQKFCSSALKFALLRDVDAAHFTFDEYKTLVAPTQTDKDGNIIYLYATNPTEQYSYIRAAKEKGYSVLLMDGQLDPHFISMLEQKLEKTRLVRVDSDIVDHLIVKDDKKEAALSTDETDILSTMFRSRIPAVEKAEFLVQFEALGAAAAPATITQNEFMRRMKEMSRMQPGMDFYGDMPDTFSLIVNTDHPAVKAIIEAAAADIRPTVDPLRSQIASINASIADLRKQADALKADTAKADAAKADTDSAKNADTVKETRESLNKQISDREAQVADLRKQEHDAETAYAATLPKVRQVIDLSLLAAGLLKGQALSEFIARSASLL